jgi:hypothetical protein
MCDKIRGREDAPKSSVIYEASDTTPSNVMPPMTATAKGTGGPRVNRALASLSS